LTTASRVRTALEAGRYVCIAITIRQGSRAKPGASLASILHHKSRDKGTGLGLAMVYGFGQAVGGTVRVYTNSPWNPVRLYCPWAELLHPVPKCPSPQSELGCIVWCGAKNLLESPSPTLPRWDYSFQPATEPGA